jgi:hypothetical protein
MFDKLIDKLADRVSQKVVEHMDENPTVYNVTNNTFDGGLVGDPEGAAKRVLEILEKAKNDSTT